MPAPAHLDLDTTARQDLCDLCDLRDHAPKAYLRERAAVLLAIAAGDCCWRLLLAIAAGDCCWPLDARRWA